LKTDTSAKLRIDAIKAGDLASFRRKLMQIEAKFSQFYFKTDIPTHSRED
jgi:hypothetical protein